MIGVTSNQGSTRAASSSAWAWADACFAQALEGKLGTEGLAAMAGDDGGSVAMALAKSLAHKINEGDAQRVWAKVALGTGTGEDERRVEEPVILQMPTVSRAERLARLRARLAMVDVEAIRQRGRIAN